MTEKREFIESLDVGERDVYAEMIMRSLRGSWAKPEARTKILLTIADVGGLLVYDEEDLENKVNSYLNIKSNDGRYFRSFYGKVNIPEITSEERVRLMANHIPNDLTWDEWRIEKEFGEQ